MVGWLKVRTVRLAAVKWKGGKGREFWKEFVFGRDILEL